MPTPSYLPSLVSYLGAPELHQNEAELLAAILGGDGSDYAALDAIRPYLAMSPKIREGALTRICLREGHAIIDDSSSQTWDVAAFSALTLSNMEDGALIEAGRRIGGRLGQLADDFEQLIAGSTCALTSPRNHIRHLLQFVTVGQLQA